MITDVQISKIYLTPSQGSKITYSACKTIRNSLSQVIKYFQLTYDAWTSHTRERFLHWFVDTFGLKGKVFIVEPKSYKISLFAYL